MNTRIGREPDGTETIARLSLIWLKKTHTGGGVELKAGLAAHINSSVISAPMTGLTLPTFYMEQSRDHDIVTLCHIHQLFDQLINCLVIASNGLTLTDFYPETNM